MELSKRMQAIADLVPWGLRVCDVGCDHAYIPIYLMEEEIAASALACDVKEGPLKIAEANIKEHGLEDKIITRLGSGLTNVSAEETDLVIIAGMGGKLVIRILEESMDKVRRMKVLLLQPQSEVEEVRAFLRDNHLQILQENMVEEDGKYYQILKVSPSDTITNQTLPLSQETVDLFGPCLLMDKNPVLLHFLRYKQTVCEKILMQMDKAGVDAGERRPMEERLSRINEALSYMES